MTADVATLSRPKTWTQTGDLITGSPNQPLPLSKCVRPPNLCLGRSAPPALQIAETREDLKQNVSADTLANMFDQVAKTVQQRTNAFAPRPKTASDFVP